MGRTPQMWTVIFVLHSRTSARFIPTVAYVMRNLLIDKTDNCLLSVFLWQSEVRNCISFNSISPAFNIISATQPVFSKYSLSEWIRQTCGRMDELRIRASQLFEITSVSLSWEHRSLIWSEMRFSLTRSADMQRMSVWFLEDRGSWSSPCTPPNVASPSQCFFPPKSC